MVNNFKIIKNFLSFAEEDCFYFLQIIRRKKENINLASNSKLIKTYFITSREDLEKNKEEIITLCKVFNARAYISLSRKSLFNYTLNVISHLSDRVSSGNLIKIWKSFSSQATLTKGTLVWLVDVDKESIDKKEKIKETINACEPLNKNKILLEVPTISGMHLITSPFNSTKFKLSYPNIDIHKDCLTLLYYNNEN